MTDLSLHNWIWRKLHLLMTILFVIANLNLKQRISCFCFVEVVPPKKKRFLMSTIPCNFEIVFHAGVEYRRKVLQGCRGKLWRKAGLWSSYMGGVFLNPEKWKSFLIRIDAQKSLLTCLTLVPKVVWSWTSKEMRCLDACNMEARPTLNDTK